MLSASAAEAVGSFRTPTVADIPGLMQSSQSAAAPQAAASTDAGRDDERPLNYADARALLDFLARKGEGMRPGPRQRLEQIIPEILDAYKSMLVEFDRLKADLEETLRAVDALTGRAPAGAVRMPGDGYARLGPPADDGVVLDEARVDHGYELVRKLGDMLARTGSARVTESAERIELCYLALESEVQTLQAQLAGARAKQAALSAGAGASRIPGVAAQPPFEAAADQFRLSAEQVKFFEENGYLGPLTLCSPEEMARIRRWIDRSGFMHRASPIYGAGSPRGTAEARDWHLVIPEIYELCTHPALVAVMEALLGPDLILWRSQFMRKESGGNALAWHQDGSFPGGAVVPAVDPMKTVSSWLAIDEARIENGCVWMVPGTHKGTLDYVRKEANRGQGLFGRGFEVEYAVAADRAVPMVLQPGQFVVFDCQTLHGSSHNPSPWRRLGLATRYTSTEVKVYENQQVDGQGYALGRFGCILVRGEDRYGHNVMAQPPKR